PNRAMQREYRKATSRRSCPPADLPGPAIKPTTLRLVWETRKAVQSPIIGLGGIETVEDVLEYLSVGASAVQVGTASFTDPRASERLVEALTNVLERAKVVTLNKVRYKLAAENI